MQLKLVLGVIVIFSSLGAQAQTEKLYDVEWFDSFFQDNHQQKRKDFSELELQVVRARDAQDAIAETRARKELGLRQMTLIPDYEKALANFIRCLQIEDSLNLQKDRVITYLAMSRVFEELSDFRKSAELLGEATELSRPDNDVNTLVYILNKQGQINTMLGNTADALESYELVLKQKGNLSTRKPEANAYYNIGHLHMRNGNHDKALEYLKLSLAIWRELKDGSKEAQTLNEIGELYRLLKNNERALSNHTAALKIRIRLGDLKGVSQSYNNIGILFYLQKDFSRAVANLQLGLKYANDLNLADERARSYEYLSASFRETGDFKTALDHAENYSKMIDLINSEKIEHVLLEKQNHYHLEKNEATIRNLEMDRKERELKLEAQKKVQNFLFVLIGLGIIIMLLVFYLYLLKTRTNKSLQAAHAKVNQQNAELQNLNATKDKFFSIISHDLKGPLNSFTAFSGMLINHTDSLTKEEIQMLAKEIDKNLKNLFALLENLLEWSRSQTGSIEFKPEIFDMDELLKQNHELLATQAKNKNVILNLASDGSYLVNAHRHSVNTVTRNLISNAIKFTSAGGMVNIRARSVNNKVTVTISDTGVGMTAETIQKLFRIDTKYSTNGTANEKGTGLGLILCKEFIEKNGGIIGVESEPGKGSDFYFSLPAHSLN